MSATRNEHWVAVEHGACIGRRDWHGFSSEDIADLLDKAAWLGFDLGPSSALEDVTLRELQMLVADLSEN